MATVDVTLLDFPTYNDYLDSFILTTDRRYLRNIKFCRSIVQVGYRSASAILTEEQFELSKILAEENLLQNVKSRTIFSQDMTSKDPVLVQLAIREKPNVQKTISTIIFVKAYKNSGFEISGYIDYEHSLRLANIKADNCVDWLGVFQEKVMLKPQPTDLSFYDWKRSKAKSNNSDNYIVLHDFDEGLTFLHRGDHKKICVSKRKNIHTKNFIQSCIFSKKYGYVVLYDHIARKKI